MALFNSELIERARQAVRHGIDRIPTGGPLSRADQRVWDEVESLADAGELVARWLEGDMETVPGYYGRPAPETEQLIPELAELNRAGFVTFGSQPGEGPVRGDNNTWWWQRAFVDGISDVPVADRIEAASKVEGLEPIRYHGASRRMDYSRSMPVSATQEHVAHGQGIVATSTGGRLSRSALKLCFDGYLHNRVCRAEQTSVVDPVWGRNSLLLPTLTRELTRDERETDERTDPLVREPVRERIEIHRVRPDRERVTDEPIERAAGDPSPLDERTGDAGEATSKTSPDSVRKQRKDRVLEDQDSPAVAQPLVVPTPVRQTQKINNRPTERTVDGSELTAKWVEHMRTGEQVQGVCRDDEGDARCANGHLLEARDPDGWLHGRYSLMGHPRVHQATSEMERRYGKSFLRDIARRNDHGESLDRLAAYVERNAQDREAPKDSLERER